MTIKEAFKKYPESETELLLGHVLKQSKEFLYLHPEKKLTLAQANKLRQMVSKYRRGYPLAYLLGYKDFYGYRYKVTKDTLIPRPESEWLVERALQLISKGKTKTILDIGTGSGCLAISIAKRAGAKASVYAVDISGAALKVARQNAKKLTAKVNFRQQDLLTKDKATYDLIIANLPYVPQAQYKKLYQSLKHEPKSALIDPGSDFALYKKLLGQVPGHLSATGTVILEIDPSMKPLIQEWCKKYYPQAKPKFPKDIHGLWRYCELTGF